MAAPVVAARTARQVELGDFVAAGDGRVYAAVRSGSGAGAEGCVKMLRPGRSAVATVELAPEGSPTSLPSLATRGSSVYVAWRSGGVGAPSGEPEGVYSRVIDGGLARPVGLRSLERPVAVDVAPLRGPGYLLAWFDPAERVGRVQQVSGDGRAGEPRTLAPPGRGPPRLARSLSGAVWAVYGRGRLRILRLDLPPDETEDFVIDGGFRVLDVAGDRRDGVLVLSQGERPRGVALYLTHVSDGIAFTSRLARASKGRRFRARVEPLGDGSVVAYSTTGAGGRGDVFLQRAPRGGRLLEPLERRLNATRSPRGDDKLLDVAVDPRTRRVHLLSTRTRARGGGQDLELRQVQAGGRRLQRSRATNVSRSPAPGGAGRLALDRRGKLYVAWEQTLRRGTRWDGPCAAVVATAVR